MNTTIITDTSARPITNKELAAAYGISTKTLRSWLLRHQEHIGPKVGRYYNSRQVRIIYERLGEPTHAPI